MRNVTATYGCVTPFEFRLDQKVLKCLLLSFSVLVLTGCVTSSTSKPLAMMPPVASFHSKHFYKNLNDQELMNVAQIDPEAGQVDGAMPSVVTSPLVEMMGRKLSLNQEEQVPDCRIKDRFDRKAILAYEWNRSRVALDVDGLNVGLTGVSDFEAVRLEYRLRLQPEKPRREKCRFKSRWQGIVGSGYNELFVRENDTVWQELRGTRKKVSEAFGRVF